VVEAEASVLNRVLADVVALVAKVEVTAAVLAVLVVVTIVMVEVVIAMVIVGVLAVVAGGLVVLPLTILALLHALQQLTSIDLPVEPTVNASEHLFRAAKKLQNATLKSAGEAHASKKKIPA
jgi:hypothetical protein